MATRVGSLLLVGGGAAIFALAAGSKNNKKKNKEDFGPFVNRESWKEAFINCTDDLPFSKEGIRSFQLEMNLTMNLDLRTDGKIDLATSEALAMVCAARE